MAETTRERATEQAMGRAEDTMGTMVENGRKSMQAMMDYNRSSVRTGYEFARNLQEESLRLTDAWLDHMTQFQKTYLKSFHTYTNRFQDLTERTVRENNDRMEETLDQSMEMVTPGGRTPVGAKRR